MIGSFATMVLMATLTQAQVSSLEDYGKLDDFTDKLVEIYWQKHPYCEEIEIEEITEGDKISFYFICTAWST